MSPNNNVAVVLMVTDTSPRSSKNYRYSDDHNQGEVSNYIYTPYFRPPHHVTRSMVLSTQSPRF